MARVIDPDGAVAERFTNAGSQAVANAVNTPSGNSDVSPVTTGANPPNEGLYGQYQAQALDAYEKAKVALQQRRSGIYQSYGFNQDGSVDGNNSVGGYQQMKHAQALELQAAENQAHERHLGGRGLGAQVANAPRFQEDVDAANFAGNYLSALDENSGQLSEAGNAYQQALIDARRAQIEDDIANGRYDTPAPDASTDVSAYDNPPAVGARAKAAAARLTATSRQTARSTEKAPAKKATSKPLAYKGRH